MYDAFDSISRRWYYDNNSSSSSWICFSSIMYYFRPVSIYFFSSLLLLIRKARAVRSTQRRSPHFRCQEVHVNSEHSEKNTILLQRRCLNYCRLCAIPITLNNHEPKYFRGILSGNAMQFEFVPGMTFSYNSKVIELTSERENSRIRRFFMLSIFSVGSHHWRWHGYNNMSISDSVRIYVRVRVLFFSFLSRSWGVFLNIWKKTWMK